MQNRANAAVITLIAMAVWIGCDGKKPDRGSTLSPGSTPAASSPAEKPIAVQAKTLTKEYDENELAADQKYNGKTLAVTGKVSNIADTLGNITVQLEGIDIGKTVMCSFDEGEKQSVSRLKKGQQTTLIGTGDGMTAGLYVGLTKCSIAN